MAVGLAIRKTLESARENAFAHFPGAADILKLLEDQSESFYENLAQSSPRESSTSPVGPTVADLAKTDVLATALEEPLTATAAPFPTRQEWREFLEDLFSAAVPETDRIWDDLRPAFQQLQEPLALYLAEHVSDTFRELMKSANAYPGSNIAKARAAIELHVWTQLLAFVRKSPVRGVDEKTLADRIENGLRAMDERSMERNAELLKAIAGLAPNIAPIRDDVAFLADSAKSGLISLDEFSARYWRRQSRDPGMRHLLHDELRARLLKASFPGRERELKQFREFLNGDKEVLYYFADPGAGKSRLMLELAGIAKEEGWRSEFVDSLDLKDRNLVNAWRGLKDPHGQYILIWDDYRPGNRENLRQFLNLHELMGGDHRPRIKRIITSWQVFRYEIEDDGIPWWLESCALPLIDGKSDSWNELIQNLSGSVTFPKTLQSLVAGNPQICMFAVNLLLQGKDPAEFAGYDGICKASYGPFVGMIDAADRQAFRVLCACGQIEAEDAEAWTVSLERLWKGRFIERQGGVYRTFSDVLRMFVCRWSLLEDGNPLSLASGDPASEWASCAKGLFPYGFAEAWSIATLALAGLESASRRVKTKLLQIAREMAADNPAFWETAWALTLVRISFEQDPAPIPYEIASEVGRIACRQSEPSPLIDAAWAQAVANAIYRAPLAVKRELAGEIGRLAQRNPAGSSPRFDTSRAHVLFNSMDGENSESVSRAIANEIEGIAESYLTPVLAIDEWWALALANATARVDSVAERREIVGKIERIVQRQPIASERIDGALARALFNVTPPDASPPAWRKTAGEIAYISQRHVPSVAEIDEVWVEAFFKAPSLDDQRPLWRETAAEIGRIAQRHVPPVTVIDERWAMALANAIAPSESTTVQREITGELERISQRQAAPVALIDECWAKALFNIAQATDSAQVEREIAGEIGRIAQHHIPPVPKIDEFWALALFLAGERQDSALLQKEIAGEIERIARQYDPPVMKIDAAWAGALLSILYRENSAAGRHDIADEIGRIAQRSAPPAVVIDECWAQALRGTVARDDSALACRKVAEKIGHLALHHAEPVAAIDECWAQALLSVTAREETAPVRREIAFEIGRIAQRHFPPVPEIDDLWARGWMATIWDLDGLADLPCSDPAFRTRVVPRIMAVWYANQFDADAALAIGRLTEILAEFDDEGS
ncbi:MAG: hypothetical protein ABI806_04830 [Candidatus Solibacter sp.]